MKSNLAACIIFTLIITHSWNGAYGQIQSAEYSKKEFTVSKYEVLDVTFKSRKKQDQPFNIEFGALFTSPDGHKLKVPGIYNGDKEWLLRFSANQEGTWEFITYSSLKELSDRKGNIVVVKSLAGKHGPIIIDKENPKKFSYEDGTPHVFRAFECDWLFALDYDNPEAAPKTEHLLKLLAQNGINQIVTTVYSYEVRWEKDKKLLMHPEHDYGSRDYIYPFLGTNNNPDYSELNIDFFKRFDRIVSLMEQNDISAHIMIYVWNKLVNWPEEGSEADKMFVDYVVKRYQAFPNVLWDVAKEAARRPDEYVISLMDRIQELNTYDRLVTVHDHGFCKKYTDKVDYISIQNWHHTIYSDMLRANDEFDKPVFNIEHGGYTESYYETFPGAYVKAEDNLRRNYFCYFAGVYATYYWQGAAWNVIIHNPFEQPEEFIKPKFEYFKHMEEFFNRINYNDFYPYPRGNKSGYCLKSDDESLLYYIPRENYQLSVYNQLSKSVKHYTYQWFNTISGEYTEEMKYESGNIKAPWMGQADAILIMKPDTQN